MYCPRCLAEYREGFTRCADCGVALVKTLPQAEPPDPSRKVEFVTVLECRDAVALALAQGTLEDAGIPYLVNGLRFGVPLLEYRPSIADVPCRIQVSQDNARKARVLLERLSGN